jgi:hypothetical protein
VPTPDGQCHCRNGGACFFACFSFDHKLQSAPRGRSASLPRRLQPHASYGFTERTIWPNLACQPRPDCPGAAKSPPQPLNLLQAVPFSKCVGPIRLLSQWRATSAHFCGVLYGFLRKERSSKRKAQARMHFLESQQCSAVYFSQ